MAEVQREGAVGGGRKRVGWDAGLVVGWGGGGGGVIWVGGGGGGGGGSKYIADRWALVLVVGMEESYKRRWMREN
jgi:hypothetical protein